MTPLRWTRTPPTEAGWWWIQEGREKPAIVRVSESNDPERSGLLVEWSGWECFERLCEVTGQWAGPVAPPEEGS